MEVVRVQPIDRLPNLSHDIAPNLMYNLPRYSCPHCSEYSVFETGNPASSPFSIETAALFDKFIGPQDLEGWKKADFFCRVCSRPVRIYFEYTEIPVGKDAYGYVARAVLETK